MSILFEKLPCSVNIDGTDYEIDTDYRIMAKFENAILKTDRRNTKAVATVFSDTMIKFYKEKLPPNVNEAINKIWWFYRCGEDINSRRNKVGCSAKNERLYDYDIDGAHIAAAFQSQYGIDLTSCDLHWWLFKSYLSGLDSECNFVKIMCYRGMDLKQIKNARERNRYKRLKIYMHYLLLKPYL